jgi:hypothetical protein
MNVKEIIETYLKENGYDGLQNYDDTDCACYLDDLCPCGGHDHILSGCNAFRYRKAIYKLPLVPECCEDCRLQIVRLDGSAMCVANSDVDIKDVPAKSRHLKCPLKTAFDFRARE